MKNNFGYIFCKDNFGSGQKRWLNYYELLFNQLGIKPHIISSSKEVRTGYKYIWRPNHDNFQGIYKNKEELSIELCNMGREYEENGAHLLPSSNDLSYYENKKKILQETQKHNINIPKSVYIDDTSETINTKESLTYPVLFKYPYGCSSFGLQICNEISDYDIMIDRYLSEFGSVIVQEQIKIKKDLRINYIYDQALCNYWRVKSGETTSTATWTGSNLDFFSIPFKGISFAKEVGKKLNIKCGGVDIVWDNDNIDGSPILLEISPIFELNPIPMKPVKWKSFKHGYWNYIPKLRHNRRALWNKFYDQIYMLFTSYQISYLINEMDPK